MTSVPPPFQHPGPPPLRPELPYGAPEPPALPDAEPRLGVPWWAPFVAMLAAFAGVLVLSLIVGVAIGVSGGDIQDATDSDAMTIGLTIGQDALLIAAAWFTAQVLSGRTPSLAAFGLRVPDIGTAIRWTLLLYGCFWIASIVVLSIFGQPEEQEIVRDLKAEQSLSVLIGFGVLTCVIAPLTEEFFFRGFMFQALRERMHLVWAALIAGFAFGLVHLPGGDPLAVLVLGLLGVVLCLVLWRTGSLIPCIMLHAFHNSMSFGLTKELPWWGFLLLIAGSVMTTLAISLLVLRLGRLRAARPVPA
jgi:membrane protease YdiL (CAAX protease family)